jgi:hypothetical protein
LKAHLQENGVDADPRQVATAFIALAREKVNRQGDAALLAWIEQLAIDVVQP